MKSGHSDNPLPKYLEKKNLGVREFARAANIAKSTVHDILTGLSAPSKKTANKICRATKFEITLQDFGL